MVNVLMDTMQGPYSSLEVPRYHQHGRTPLEVEASDANEQNVTHITAPDDQQFQDATAIELYLGLDSRLRAIELAQNILLIPNISSNLWQGHINTSNPRTRKQHEKMIWLLDSLWWICFEYPNQGHKNFDFLM
ncbi:methylated-dna--protein-cysteine methyltransferase [Limosa lapponica baueri]|uniref:Methylated-dna--protein-cysteine methyltransferase n=1 Tax=Limosa lapponica baueri TaxID=1758121 RepID=A0A2I0TA14_LIMLA|nr:methylated-dna--protein-cysteine methyltransferase [Limosa lapponica baueri]